MNKVENNLSRRGVPEPVLRTIESVMASYPHGQIRYDISPPMPFPAARGLTTPVIAIGDVHGHSAPFAVLLRELMEAYPHASIRFLGDLIHRGPDSGGALALAIVACMAIEDERGGRTAMLHPGNHEEMLLNVLALLEGNEAYADHLPTINLLEYIKQNQAWETPFLSSENPSWAIQHDVLKRMPKDFAAILSDLGGLSPWLMHCPVASQSGDIVFVHAGIAATPDAERDPVAWAEKHPLLLTFPEPGGPRWIHRGVVGRKRQFPNGRVIVFGHMIDPAYAEVLEDGRFLEIDPSAPTLGIDSGSYDTGVITGAIFETGTIRLAHVRFDQTAQMATKGVDAGHFVRED